VLLLGLVPLPACAAADMTAADPARSQQEVLGAARDLLAGLTSVGSFGRPPRAGWSGCDDLGGKVAYRVSGRLDVPGDAEGALTAVRARLAAAGVDLRDVSAPGDGPTTLQGASGGLRMQVTGYPDRPVVVLSLVGPCLDVGDDDRRLLAEPPERVRLA
jgi:hypothetical protein